MLNVFKSFCLAFSMLTLAACQNDPYIKPCIKVTESTVKTFHRVVEKGDKLRANALCTCKSRGIQSVITANHYEGLLKATKAEKNIQFRNAESRYLNELISIDPNLGAELSDVMHRCSKHGVAVKRNYYYNKRNYNKKKEPPTSPY